MLQQRDGALRLGVHAASVRNWESGRTEPALDLLRSVIEFLSYDPRPTPNTIGEKIKFWRTARGLSQEELGRSGELASTRRPWPGKKVEGGSRGGGG